MQWKRCLHLVHHEHHPLLSYSAAESLQSRWRSAHLLFKSNDAPRPPPYLLTFETTPIYTFGRQQHPSDEPLLRQPLTVSLPLRNPPVPARRYVPDIARTPRGGLTTYHGPGQLVIWPVVDMHSPDYPRLNVSSYAGLLEGTTQALLAEMGIRTFTDEGEPGVWVAGEPARKIAALGVHHRRYVTALGTALNVDVDTGEGSAWARFVPCGIEGKSVTSVVREAGWDGDMPGLASRWAEIFERALLEGQTRR